MSDQRDATQQDVPLAMARHIGKMEKGHIIDMVTLWRAALDDKAALIQAYTTTDTALRKLVNKYGAQAEAAEAHIVELTTKCDGLTAANVHLEAQLAALQSTTDVHQANVECLKGHLQASEQHARDLSAREASAVNAQIVLQSKIGTLQTELRTAVCNTYEYKQRHDTLELACKGLMDADAQQKSDLVASEVRLMIAKAAVQASGQKLEALAAEKDSMIANLRDELAKSKADAERAIAEALRTRQNELDAASIELEASRTRLVGDVATAEASTSLPDLFFIDDDHFAGDLQRLEDDHAAATTRLSEAATVAAASKATIDALSADKRTLTATVQEQKEGLVAMTLQLSNAVARTDASAQQIAALLGEKNRLTSVVKQHDAAIAALKAKLTKAATAAKAASTAVIEALSADKRALAATVKEKSKALTVKTSELDKAVTFMDSSSQQIESLLGETSRLSSTVQQHEAVIAALKAELDHAKAELDHTKSELDHTKAELDHTKAESQQRVDTSTRMCTKLEAEKDHLHLTIVQLSMDLDVAKEAIALQQQAADAKQQETDALLGETSRLTSIVEQQEAVIAETKSELAEAAATRRMLLDATIRESTDALAAMKLQLHDAMTCADTKTQQIEALLGEKSYLASMIQQHEAAIAASAAELNQMKSEKGHHNADGIQGLSAEANALIDTVQQLQADLDASNTALALVQDAAAASAQQNEALTAANRHLVLANGQLTTAVATAKTAAASAQALSDFVANASAKHTERVNASKTRLLETIRTLQTNLGTPTSTVCDQCAHWKALLAQSSNVIASLRADLAATLDRATPPADVVRAFFARVHETFPILRYSAIEVLIDGIYAGDTHVFEATDGFQVYSRC